MQIAEEFYQNLEIPYRVMLTFFGGYGEKYRLKTYDIEAWMAGQNSYREIVSCSNCLELSSKKTKDHDLEIKQTRKLKYSDIHLNSTLIATSRVLVSIMENFQKKDGHITIPQVFCKNTWEIKNTI